MEKKTENTIVYWGLIGIMEKKMETTIVCWSYSGVKGNKWKLLRVKGFYVSYSALKAVI